MADFLDWNYNHFTGAVMHLPSVQSAVMRAMGLGWHGPFNTKDEVLTFYYNNRDAHPDWREPTGLVGNIGNALTAPGRIASQVVTDPLGRLNLGGWFLRIGEILIGSILLGVGLAHLLGYQDHVTKVIGKVIKGAVT